MLQKKTLPQTYLNDIALHSNIEKNQNTAPIFEHYIASKIKDFLIDSQQIKNEIIFSDFIKSTNFDYVLITQKDTLLTFYYLPNAEKEALEIYQLLLIDTNDKYKQYFNLDIKPLPERLKNIIKKHNNKTQKDIITAHRVICALNYDISQLDVHHCTLTRYNPNGTLKRLKQPLNINELLPCSRDFHLNILHAYINDCITTEDEKTLTECSFECLTALKNYTDNINAESTMEYKKNPYIIESILTEYKNGQKIKTISELYEISKPTISRIINDYEILADWIYYE